MEMLFSLKHTVDDFTVEYDVLTPFDPSGHRGPREQQILAGLETVEEQIAWNQERIDEINLQLDKLTNQSDGLNYILAVSSGVIAGIVDALWVGEFSFKEGKAWSNEQVNRFVERMAERTGYAGEGRLEGAIKHLEEKFKIPSDNVWKGTNQKISARSHHLDDLAHHPTPLGLVCSILTQFTKTAYFQNREGEFIKIGIENGELVGGGFKEKIIAGAANWFFHLVSDMSGSKKTAGAGMGIPGPIVSLLKELSMIPGINKLGLSEKLHEIFVTNKFDLRSEMAVGHQLGKQALPVLINEILVRLVFFLNRVREEYQEGRSFKGINWARTVPFRNRTVVRMLTIAAGTFTAIDLADASIRSAVKSGGFGPEFLRNFVLRVNFVGIGRFAIACWADGKMEVQEEKLRSERIQIFSQQLQLLNAKLSYRQADVWISAENTAKTLEQAYVMINQTTSEYLAAVSEVQQDMGRITEHLPGVRCHNPKLLQELSDALRRG